MATPKEEDEKTDAELNKELREFFMASVEKAAAKKLSVAEKSTGGTKVVSKMMKDTFTDAQIITDLDSSCFPKYQDRSTKKVTVDQFINNILPDLAEKRVKGKKPKPKDDEIKDMTEKELKNMKKKLCKKYGDWKKPTTGKDAAVVSRLTDTKGYTGAHKERFGKDGQGKGKQGREDIADNSGYVGGYKGKDTFDEKH